MKFFQIDAFASELFRGNPAGVVPLASWISKDLMIRISAENNLSETAFFVAHDDGVPGHYDLRWFTPTMEVDLCGHATLASAFVIFNKIAPDLDQISFETRSGTLMVTREKGGWLSMNFPAIPTEELADERAHSVVTELLGVEPVVLRKAANLMVVLGRQQDVEAIVYKSAIGPVLEQLGFWGMMITAPGAAEGSADFVSRFFAPAKGIPEDPVTGSAHRALTPYWSQRLGKIDLVAKQLSPRGGELRCVHRGDRVVLYGQCTPYLEGELSL